MTRPQKWLDRPVTVGDVLVTSTIVGCVSALVVFHYVLWALS